MPGISTRDPAVFVLSRRVPLSTSHDVATIPGANPGALESRFRGTPSALHRSGSMRHRRQDLPGPTGLVRAAEAGAVRRGPARGHQGPVPPRCKRATAPENLRGLRAAKPPARRPGPPCTAGRCATPPRSPAGASPPARRSSCRTRAGRPGAWRGGSPASRATPGCDRPPARPNTTPTARAGAHTARSAPSPPTAPIESGGCRGPRASGAGRTW